MRAARDLEEEKRLCLHLLPLAETGQAEKGEAAAEQGHRHGLGSIEGLIDDAGLSAAYYTGSLNVLFDMETSVISVERDLIRPITASQAAANLGKSYQVIAAVDALAYRRDGQAKERSVKIEPDGVDARRGSDIISKGGVIERERGCEEAAGYLDAFARASYGVYFDLITVARTGENSSLADGTGEVIEG